MRTEKCILVKKLLTNGPNCLQMDLIVYSAWNKIPD